MLALTRFRVPRDGEASFRAQAAAASAFYRTRPGCQWVELQRNLDDPELWVLASCWQDVGSYRRAYNGYEAKVVLTPLLLLAIDEPGAYDEPDAGGVNIPRGEA